jgi:demethylmenaquinone methyltransferase/2-methoxy-6-polyprenyl-1,4-benzoquinol methylase
MAPDFGLRPHPTLGRYYETDEDRPEFVSDMFDEGAASYEWVCSVMSLGTGAQYRRQTLRRAGLIKGMRVLDVATGTGLVLRPADELTGATKLAIGLDPSRGMLKECRKQSSAPLVQARGECLPFADQYFDMVSMGYGLRHVADLRALFCEYRRVLKPGGRVLVLEITQPKSAVGRQFNHLFLGKLVPGVARLAKGAEAGRMMDYFWDTVKNCVPPDQIVTALREAGFPGASRTVMGGVLSEFVAIRPS